ncbi:hypothetical protein [Parasphaerochaeta coccoides]|uniref:Antitoxin VbhA domain-containing protein n=1 Tax=Parasphaerochaeta coccoides (strain ATCC BAA-1237 / DSM 17374 / SPN1) TaxID=760011 RepID=F4GH92_PARC1|nr:hypothetical protein [Parasphaerochaeta coccoides]AEC01991.1 hypothetical protein Spico_0766 [Parasphaerochaeta coccoides DSM 17374]
MTREEQIDDAIKQTKAIFAIEGMYVTEEEEELLRRESKGEITTEEYNRLSVKAAYDEFYGSMNKRKGVKNEQ